MAVVPILVGLETAIGLGSVYALIALSFTLIYAATGYLHFALGTIVMLGTIGAFEASTANAPLALAVPLIVVCGGALGLGSYVLSVKPVRRRSARPADAVLLSTMGLAFAITAVVAATFGSATQVVPSYVSDRPIFVGKFPIVLILVVVTGITLIISFALHFFLTKTHAGNVARACQEDQTRASLAGINVARIIAVMFALAGGLATFAGFLIAPLATASAYAGTSLFVYGASAMIIGGFGSFAGAWAGGMVIGFINGLGPVFLPVAASDLMILGVMVLILLLRPSGLLGARGLRVI